MAVNSLFDVVKNLTSEKDKEGLGSKFFTSFMVTRFLSMDINYVPIASAANRLIQWAPKFAQEKFFFYSIPKKRVFLKYIKGDKLKEQDLSSVIEELNISDKKAVELLEFSNKLNMARNGL